MELPHCKSLKTGPILSTSSSLKYFTITITTKPIIPLTTMIIIITIRSAQIGFEKAGIDDDTIVKKMTYASKIVLGRLTRPPDSISSNKTSGFNRTNNTACIIATGAIRLTKQETLLQEVGLETLKSHRRHHRLVYLCKIKNKLTPSYLSNLHSMTNHNTLNYNF